MTGLIICCVGFLISAICFAIALHLEKQENERLRDANKHFYKRFFEPEPRYDVLRKFVIIDRTNLQDVYNRIEKAYEEGYEYDHSKSFQEVLCFVKYVEIKDETPAES